jgi:uncharacterized protein (DUF952 family)
VGLAEWRAACEVGRYAPESLATEGFVHFSFRHQVAGTANLRYHDRQDLIVVEIDPALVAAPVVVEDLYGMKQEFPHIYAAIPTEAAVGEHQLGRTADGDFSFG